MLVLLCGCLLWLVDCFGLCAFGFGWLLVIRHGFRFVVLCLPYDGWFWFGVVIGFACDCVVCECCCVVLL